MKPENSEVNTLLFTSDMKPAEGGGYTRISLFRDEHDEYSLASTTYDENSVQTDFQLISFDENVADSLQLSLTFTFMDASQKEAYNNIMGEAAKYEQTH